MDRESDLSVSNTTGVRSMIAGKDPLTFFMPVLECCALEHGLRQQTSEPCKSRSGVTTTMI